MTLAADLGFGAEQEVSMNVEAIVTMDPIFYMLDKFEINPFIHVHAALGLNNMMGEIIKDLLTRMI